MFQLKPLLAENAVYIYDEYALTIFTSPEDGLSREDSSSLTVHSTHREDIVGKGNETSEVATGTGGLMV